MQHFWELHFVILSTFCWITLCGVHFWRGGEHKPEEMCRLLLSILMFSHKPQILQKYKNAEDKSTNEIDTMAPEHSNVRPQKWKWQIWANHPIEHCTKGGTLLQGLVAPDFPNGFPPPRLETSKCQMDLQLNWTKTKATKVKYSQNV